MTTSSKARRDPAWVTSKSFADRIRSPPHSVRVCASTLTKLSPTVISQFSKERVKVMAPRTKPTELKRLHGDNKVHPGRVNAHEPKPDLLVSLDPPMELDPSARDVWDHFAPMLHRMRLLTEADVLSLAAMCTSWSTYRQASTTVQSEGALTMGARGQLVRNPAALVAKDALADYMRLATEFGLTPSSRARIVLPVDGGSDPLDDLLKG